MSQDAAEIAVAAGVRHALYVMKVGAAKITKKKTSSFEEKLERMKERVASERLKTSQSNWQDYMSGDEMDQYWNAVSKARTRTGLTSMGGAALGALAGARVGRSPAPMMVGGLLGGIGGAQLAKKTIAREPLREARSLMIRGGKKRTADRKR